MWFPAWPQEQTGELTEFDLDIIRELEEASNKTWEEQRSLLTSLSILSEAEVSIIAGSNSAGDLRRKLSSENTVLVEIADYLENYWSPGNTIKVRHISTYNRGSRSKTDIVAEAGPIRISCRQYLYGSEKMGKDGLMPAISFTQKPYLINAGALRPRSGFGALMGPVRGSGLTRPGIRSALRRAPSVYVSRTPSEKSVVKGISIIGITKHLNWMAIGGYVEGADHKIYAGSISRENSENMLAGISLITGMAPEIQTGFSAFGSIGHENLSLSSELAITRSGGMAGVARAILNNEKLRYSLYFRKSSSSFNTMFANPVTRWSGKTMKETGLFGAIEYKGKNKRAELFFDNCWNAPNRPGMTSTSGGGSINFRAAYLRGKIYLTKEIANGPRIPEYLNQIENKEKLTTNFKTILTTGSLNSGVFTVKGSIRQRRRAGLSQSMVQGNISWSHTLFGSNITLTAARISGKGKPFTVYTYGLNLFGEAPGVPLNRQGVVAGLKLKYKIDNGGELAIKALKIKYDNSNSGKGQISVLYSFSN